MFLPTSSRRDQTRREEIFHGDLLICCSDQTQDLRFDRSYQWYRFVQTKKEVRKAGTMH